MGVGILNSSYLVDHSKSTLSSMVVVMLNSFALVSTLSQLEVPWGWEF